jgi:hypothetical protein
MKSALVRYNAAVVAVNSKAVGAAAGFLDICLFRIKKKTSHRGPKKK